LISRRRGRTYTTRCTPAAANNATSLILLTYMPNSYQQIMQLV
jgi:hypothetical protein